MKSFVFSALIGAGVIVAHWAFIGLPDRRPLPAATSVIRFHTVDDKSDWAPFRLVGHWTVSADDKRFGGLSTLGLDDNGLLAITDAGAVVRLPFPGKGASVRIADLPSGPGSPFKKSGRDSEAMASDTPGVWVAFENGHELRLFDRSFERTLQVISMRRLGWSRNRGAEGLLAGNGRLLVFPEIGTSYVAIDSRGGEPVVVPLKGRIGRLGDVASLPDGRMVALSRSISPLGIASSLKIGERDGQRWTDVIRLPFGRWANPEGIAVQPQPGGRVRLWIVTDNDFRRRVPTELIALDYKP